MPLQWQKIEVPFGFGIDETAHRFIQAPPGLQALVNGRWDKDGQVNFRPGYENIAQRSNTEKLLAFKSRLYAVYTDPGSLTNNVELALDCLNDEEQRFDKQGGKDVPSALTECTIDGRSIIARDQQGSFAGADIGIDEDNGLAVIAWIGTRDPNVLLSQRVFATVIDIETLATVTPIQEISTGATASAPLWGVKVVIEGTTAHVIYADLNAHTLRAKDYSLSSKTWGNDVVILNSVESSPTAIFDAVDSGGAKWYVAYLDTTPQLCIRSFVGTSLTDNVTIGTEDPTCITLYANLLDDRVWVMWNDSATDIKWAVYDSDLVNIVAPTVIETTAIQVSRMGIGRIGANQALFVYTLSADLLTTRPITRFVAHTDGGAAGNIMSRYSVTLESRPITDGAHVYAILGYRANATPQPTGFQSLSAFYTVALVGIGDALSPDETTCYRTCALWAQGTADTTEAPVGITYGLAPASLRKLKTFENKYWFPASVVATVDNGGVDADGKPRLIQEAGVDLCRFNLDADDRSRCAEFGQHLFVAGGQNVVFDGANIVEHGFHYPPEDCQGSINVGGGVLTAGTYQIAVVWEYRMNSGAVMRSQPILVTNAADGTTQFVVAANDAVTVTVQHLNLTQKFNPYSNVTTDGRFFQAPAAVFYRTEANGSIFYRETIETSDVFGTGASLGSVSVGASADDADIKASEQLYTTGGLLPNWTLPACDDFAVYRNRLFGISSEDKKQLVFTHVLSDAEVPAWHPFLVHRIDDDGDCTGLAVLDDNLVVFKSDAVYLLRGSGPDEKGLNSDLQVTRIQSPHGCPADYRRSIVTDPTGVYFRSRFGLQRLSRSLQIEYPGEKIQDRLGDDVDINCSCVLPNYTERIYFGYTQQDTNNTGFLVYQWNNDQWAFDQMGGNETDLIPLTMAWVNGVAYAAFQNESFVYAHRGVDDPYVVFSMIVSSNWFKFDGAEGFKRIRNIELLGEYQDSHELLVALYRDYNETTPFQIVQFTDAELNPSELQPYQVKIHVSEQRMESLAYVIVLTPTPGDSIASEAATLVAQAFDVGIKPTMMRVKPPGMKG